MLVSLRHERVRPAAPATQPRLDPVRTARGGELRVSFAPIRAILLLMALVSLMGMPYAVLMPVFAKDMLHGGPHTFGFLMAAAGVGA